MKGIVKSRWIWILFFIALVTFLGWLWLRYETVNEMYPALDKLAALPLSDRWAQPEMIKIRKLGAAAVPPLRRVLREKDSPATRFLLWLKVKWPGVTRYYSRMPDPKKLTERRWTACQVLQTLGPAAKPAVPELVQVMESKDAGDVNGGSMALWAAGIDADVCERIDESLEKGKADFGRTGMIYILADVKPPSTRTLNVLTMELTNSSPYIQKTAADVLGRLGVATPAVINGLKDLQRRSTDDLAVINCSVALWHLQKDRGAVSNVFRVLERLLQQPIAPPPGGGDGGQGVYATEQVFLKGAELFQQVPLAGSERTNALAIMESFCDKSGRIFIRMLLLPAMMDLGLTREKCLDVCMTGLGRYEDYYRLQAAGLLVSVAERFPTNEVDVDELIHDKEPGVRVYAAKIHWRNHKDAKAVVPILADLLDRKRYESYYYPQILRAALNELKEIGGEAGAARTNVATLTHDPDPKIARLARETLDNLGK